jgi:SAM-dependent methyltransferase
MPNTRKNFWKHPIPSPQEVIGNPKLKPLIESLISHVADLLGLSHVARTDAIETAFKAAKNVASKLAFEKIVKQKLVAKCDRTKMNLAIRERSSAVYEEIKSHLQGQTLLDIGCGNGLISEMCLQHFSEVQLLDVMKYVSPEVKLPFLRYREGQKLPVERQYDTVLLLTVLHHSKNPLTLLKKAWKATGKRLIIIESIFGVHGKSATGKYKLAGFVEREQIAYAVFVDWLYNRVLHDKIPVPYNFTTPQKWKETFSRLDMHLIEAKNLGQDIEIAPELHFLFVLDKI